MNKHTYIRLSFIVFVFRIILVVLYSIFLLLGFVGIMGHGKTFLDVIKMLFVPSVIWWSIIIGLHFIYRYLKKNSYEDY